MVAHGEGHDRALLTLGGRLTNMIAKHHGTKSTHLIREEVAVYGAQAHLSGNIPLMRTAVELPEGGG